MIGSDVLFHKVSVDNFVGKHGIYASSSFRASVDSRSRSIYIDLFSQCLIKQMAYYDHKQHIVTIALTFNHNV